MFVLKVVLVIIGLGIIAAIIDSIKGFYLKRYDYNIYKIQVLFVLSLAFALFFIFWIVQDGSISYDNMIALAVIGGILWVSVLIYNIVKASFISGMLVTIFQSIIGVFVVFLLILFLLEKDEKRKR